MPRRCVRCRGFGVYGSRGVFRGGGWREIVGLGGGGRLRHFVDPSLAASMLRASPERLLADPGTFGLLFESLAVRELRIYSQRGEVFHYRDDTGLEVDATIERDDGAWIAIEVKLSPAQAAVDRAARSLLRLRNKVSRSRVEQLAALMVVTSTGAAYRRPDNVQVASITALGP